MKRTSVSTDSQDHPDQRRQSDRTQGRNQYVGDVLREVHDTANWERVRALYEQCRHIRESKRRRLPNDLRDEFAKCLSDLVVCYRGREGLFVEHALAVFAEVDDHEAFGIELFALYYRDRVSSTEGMPALFETVVETSRRLRDARRFAQALAGSDTSCIMCGSMSYGPFYNVCGYRRRKAASDLDLIIVIENAAQLSEIVDSLTRLAGVDLRSMERLQSRLEIFMDQFDDGRTILSHKVTLWADETDDLLTRTGLPGKYQVSLHFLTRRVLGYVLVESSTALTRASGRKRTVLDYRDTRTRRADLPRTFAGREHAVKPRLEAVDGGWLRSMTVYLFDEADSYCPGFLQTILLPIPNMIWDGLDVRLDLVTFERKFYDRYRYELAHNPNGLVLRPSLTHVREDVFAPHIIRRFDDV